jgi:hypothetical protein
MYFYIHSVVPSLCQLTVQCHHDEDEEAQQSADGNRHKSDSLTGLKFYAINGSNTILTCPAIGFTMIIRRIVCKGG